jgi:6-phosphogluconolactonase/glucosamine-6-phosphate isomerase/deaminase
MSLDRIFEIAQKRIGVDPPLNPHPDFKVRVWDSLHELYAAFAMDMTKRILSAFLEKKDVWFIAPTGPVPQWRILANNLNELSKIIPDFNLKHVHIVMMDEYSDPEGRTPGWDVPGSFQNTIRMNFWERLDNKIRMRWEDIIFPTTGVVDKIPEIIIENGGVIDVVYGGIGWGLHFAFVDREAYTSDKWAGRDIEKWKRIRVLKAIELDASTIYQNALHTWGSNQWAVPSHANTIGPALVLGDEEIKVKYRSFWCDGICGPEINWQQMAVHVALYAEPNPELPATYLKTLPGEINVVKPLDEPIKITPR